MAVVEEDIRPAKIFAEFLKLARQDCQTYFSGIERERLSCPACGGNTLDFRFRKIGFDYEECASCGTLFVNPRPSSAAFSKYYRESQSSKYWASHFYRQTEEARRTKLIRPKARRVVELCLSIEAGRHLSVLVDVGAGYGVFCEEIRALRPDWVIQPIEPGPSLAAVCQEKGFSPIESFMEDVIPARLPPGPRLVTCFELLEHVHDPQRFCTKLAGLLDGGLLVMTTLSGTGFDIQLLGEASNSIHPPHHINFINPEAAVKLLQRCGLQPLLIETPGELDVDIVRKQSDIVQDRFLRSLVTGPQTLRESFQRFLRDNQLSSHIWIVAQEAP